MMILRCLLWKRDGRNPRVRHGDWAPTIEEPLTALLSRRWPKGYNPFIEGLRRSFSWENRGSVCPKLLARPLVVASTWRSLRSLL
jgi:hypothetical protein